MITNTSIHVELFTNATLVLYVDLIGIIKATYLEKTYNNLDPMFQADD